jgi:hypothetical protein
VDGRYLAAAASVLVFNAKSGAKSRHMMFGFFRKGNEAFRRGVGRQVLSQSLDVRTLPL